MKTTVNNNNIESKNGVNNSREEIKVGTEVWTTIELHEEYGKRGHVVRKFFADHGVWCLDIEFEDGLPKTQDDPDWHGFGMKSMNRIAEKYNGMLTVEQRGRLFLLDILLIAPED